MHGLSGLEPPKATRSSASPLPSLLPCPSHHLLMGSLLPLTDLIHSTLCNHNCLLKGNVGHGLVLLNPFNGFSLGLG